jgi:chromosome segregation ATPase
MENFHCIRSQNIKKSFDQLNNTNPIMPTNISLIRELMENNEKDLIISNQKTYIYQLELKEKEFDNLNQKYLELQNEYENLDRYKNQLELEIKQKDNNYNRDISILRADNESSQLKQNEVLIMNKKLLGENEYLKREIEIKKNEILRLNNKLNDLLNELNISKENYLKFSKENEELNNMKLYDNNEIEKLLEDNHKLYDLCQELNFSLKEAEKEKENLKSIINNNNIKLNTQDEDIKYSNEQNNKMKKNIEDMSDKIYEYEKENANLKMNLLNKENENKNIKDLLYQKDNEIKTLKTNNEELLNKQVTLNKEIINKSNDIEKYSNNCKILKEQNDELMNEMNKIISFNQKVRNILNRKEKVKNLILDNKSILQECIKNINSVSNENINQNSS